jgi:hypothetical protein
MSKDTTELQSFTEKHGAALSKLTAGLAKCAGGALIGSVVTVGIYSGAIEPSKVFGTSVIEQGDVFTARSAQPPTRLLPSDGNSIPAKNKLHIDLDPVTSASTRSDPELFELDASTADLFDMINDRANDELDALNVIRKALDGVEGFSDDRIKGSAKADTIIAGLNLARVAKNMDAVEYDNRAFKIAKGLPKTMVFNDIVETLNWKRETVRTAIDVTTRIADAMRAEDTETADVLFTQLTEIMENYEMATTIERTADKMIEAMGKQIDGTAPENTSPATDAQGKRDVSTGPLDRLGEHLRTHSIVTKQVTSLAL